MSKSKISTPFACPASRPSYNPCYILHDLRCKICTPYRHEANQMNSQARCMACSIEATGNQTVSLYLSSVYWAGPASGIAVSCSSFAEGAGSCWSVLAILVLGLHKILCMVWGISFLYSCIIVNLLSSHEIPYIHSEVYQQIWTNWAFQSHVSKVICGKGLQVYVHFCLFYLENSQSSLEKWTLEDFG